MSGSSATPGSRWSRRSRSGSGSRRWRSGWCGCVVSGRARRNAGRKVMALIYAMVLGADSIDDCERAAGRAARGRLLGGWVPAPSTLGTFLRAFTFGHVRQLDALLGRSLERAWKAGAGPGAGRLVIDVDSFVGEVCGRLKQGAAYGYTQLLGYHPLLATRADTREALHIRLRKGSANTQKGIKRFCDELIARVERAGATGVKLLRADSGFWNTKVFERLEQAGWQYSIGVRMIKTVRAAVEAIDEDAWQTDRLPRRRRGADRRDRLRRPPADRQPHPAARRAGRAVARLAPLLPSITNRDEEIALVEAEHREHAVVEQVIADLKDQALAHFPSGQFYANGAWTVLAALAHNLLRWTQLLGLPDTTVRAARTLRRRLLTRPRPPDPTRPRLDTPPPGPLALAQRLHPRAQPHPRAPRRHLTARHAHRQQPGTHPSPPRHDDRCARTPHDTPHDPRLPRQPNASPRYRHGRTDRQARRPRVAVPIHAPTESELGLPRHRGGGGADLQDPAASRSRLRPVARTS